MNARQIILLREMLMAIVVGVILLVISQFVPYLGQPVYLPLLPFILLALRHSASTAVVAAAIAGMVLIGIQQDFQLATLVATLLPLMSVGTAGFFAKYTQKTLNNRRLSSTFLNIGTAVLLVLVLYTLLDIATQIAFSSTSVHMSVTQMVMNLLIGWMLHTGILCMGAKFFPKVIIPSRSRYLSRKETTSLLND